jgi:hypothetical protein
VVTYLTPEAGGLRAHLEPSWNDALPADNVRAEQTTSEEER